jgi:hypothetical protein
VLATVPRLRFGSMSLMGVRWNSLGSKVGQLRFGRWIPRVVVVVVAVVLLLLTF